MTGQIIELAEERKGCPVIASVSRGRLLRPRRGLETGKFPAHITCDSSQGYSFIAVLYTCFFKSK